MHFIGFAHKFIHTDLELIVQMVSKVVIVLTSSRELLDTIENVETVFHSSPAGSSKSMLNSLYRFIPSIREQLQIEKVNLVIKELVEEKDDEEEKLNKIIAGPSAKKENDKVDKDTMLNRISQVEAMLTAIVLRYCFKCYFENEKRLCEQVFRDLRDETVDSCLVDTIIDYTVQLLDTTEALSSILPASERLFKILDIHDTLSDLIPSINGLFRSELSEFIRTKAKNEVIPKLADKANEILLRFENDLANEQSLVVHAEPIHQLSKYVMHYIYKLCDHKQSLMRFCLPGPPSMDAAGTISRSFSAHVVWIIMRLLSKLDVKAKLCKDPLLVGSLL
ncbi:putative exocyst complex component Exo70, cullin repeat-like-containing domain superfamily [Helianthus anomalus]